METRTVVCRTVLFAALLFLIGPLTAPKNAAAQQSAASKPKITMQLPCTLASALESKKHKAGDEVDIRTAASLDLPDGTSIPQGATVVGHIKQSTAQSKGDANSSLEIVFDQIRLGGEKTLQIAGVIQAVGPNVNGDTGSGGGVDYGNSLNRMTQHPQTASSPVGVPLLNGQSVGVIGVKDLELGSDGVIHSSAKEVKLPNGAQVMLRAQVLN